MENTQPIHRFLTQKRVNGENKGRELAGFPVLLVLFLMQIGCDIGIAGSGKKATVLRQIDYFDRVVSVGSKDYTLNINPDLADDRCLTEESQATDACSDDSDTGNEEPVDETEDERKAAVRTSSFKTSDQVWIEIEGDDNLLKYVETKVDGNLLEITSTEPLDPEIPIKIRVGVPELVEFTNQGSGDHTILNIASAEFTLSIEGSGDHVLKGVADDLIILIGGSGDVNAKELQADYAAVRIQGSGDVEVCANDEFYGIIQGSGDVTYYCSPGSVDAEIEGSGDISSG